jgi:hypothetical protein
MTLKIKAQECSGLRMLTGADLDQVCGGLTNPSPDFVGVGGGTATVARNYTPIPADTGGLATGRTASGNVDIGNGAFTALAAGGNTGKLLF